MSRRAPRPALAAALVFALAGGAHAEEPGEAWWRGTVSFINENDLWAFYGEDRYYSNGLRFGWTSDPIASGSWLAGLETFARRLPVFDGARDIRFGVALGQSIFTPSDTTATAPLPDDRPYAGWLYASASLIGEAFDDGTRAPRRLDTLELSLGVIGPAARGETTQNRWHGLIGTTDAEGWNNQLPNQPGVELYYERKWRMAGMLAPANDPELAVDAIPQLAVALGNVQTYAAAGALLRVGRNLERDWGPDRILPALTGSRFLRRGEGFGWYVFGGIQLRAVAYDAFLEGPWFRDTLSVDPEPVVADVQAGFALGWDSLRLSYTFVLRTKEFHGQDGAHRFGSLNLTAVF